MLTREAQETAAQLLKLHTARHHLALEETVLPILHSLRSPAEYIGFLTKFYGYFKPVEDRILQHIDSRILPDISERRKAGWILEDLTFSNAHTGALPLATVLPGIENTAMAFGALYVLEGSTLGGRGITRLLLKNEHLRLQPRQLRFFSGYGEETGPKWTGFLQTLNRHGQSEAAAQTMITTANETFLYFEKWLSKNA
jgi:heme oxygenase